MDDSKTLVESKTVWAALAAPFLSYGLSLLGLAVPAEVQVAVLGILNIVLRKITDKPIEGWF